MSNPYSTPGQQGPGEYAAVLTVIARQLQIVTVAMSTSMGSTASAG